METKLNQLTTIARPHIEQMFKVVDEIILNDLAELMNANKDYHQSLRVLSLFVVRVVRLTEGILDLVENDNLYASKVLLRALIEHSYKQEFLIQKSKESKNDEIFKEYLLFCDIAEELQYHKGLKYNSELLGENEVSEEFYKNLIKTRPEIQKFSKNQIFLKANQFTFRNVLKFLTQPDRNDFKIENGKKILDKFFKAYLNIGLLYSDLSSFVHGGPFADNFEFKIQMDSDSNNYEIVDTIETVISMSFSSAISFTSFCNFLNPKYETGLEDIIDSLASYYKKYNWK